LWCRLSSLHRSRLESLHHNTATKNGHTRLKTLGILIAIFSLLLFPQAARAGEASAGRTTGLRVVHVGNSHSHALRFLEPLAWAVGHAGHKDGEINILGSPLRWNWDQGPGAEAKNQQTADKTRRLDDIHAMIRVCGNLQRCDSARPVRRRIPSTSSGVICDGACSGGIA
jgi:hypothetical protein